MNYLILILILLLTTPCFAQEQQARMSIGMMGGAVAAAAGCTTASDSALFDKVLTGTADGSVYACTKFTLAATTTITEYLVRNRIITAGTGTVRVSLYTHNGGTDLPDAEISGTEKAIPGGDLSLSETTETFTLASPYTGLSSGTYWACTVATGNTARSYYYYADAGTRSCYGTSSCDGGSANTAAGISVYGCQP